MEFLQEEEQMAIHLPTLPVPVAVLILPASLSSHLVDLVLAVQEDLPHLIQMISLPPSFKAWEECLQQVEGGQEVLERSPTILLCELFFCSKMTEEETL